MATRSNAAVVTPTIVFKTCSGRGRRYRLSGYRCFVGHFATELAAKRVAPRLSPALLFAVAQLADMLGPIFVALGIEYVRIDPGTPRSRRSRRYGDSIRRAYRPCASHAADRLAHRHGTFSSTKRARHPERIPHRLPSVLRSTETSSARAMGRPIVPQPMSPTRFMRGDPRLRP